MKSNSKKSSPKQNERQIRKKVAEIRKMRMLAKVEGTKHYIDDTPSWCDRCHTKVDTPHCFEKNGTIVLHLCQRCFNVVKPKRRITRIIYTPMK